MSAYNALLKAAQRTGWNTDSMLEIACRYIDNQQNPGAFEDFVRQAAAEEDGMTSEDEGEPVDHAQRQILDQRPGHMIVNQVKVLSKRPTDGDAQPRQMSYEIYFYDWLDKDFILNTAFRTRIPEGAPDEYLVEAALVIAENVLNRDEDGTLAQVIEIFQEITETNLEEIRHRVKTVPRSYYAA